MFTSYGMSAAEERVRSSLNVTRFELKTYSIANKFTNSNLSSNGFVNIIRRFTLELAIITLD